MGKTIALTGLALVCFAANSVLCRLALGANEIDANSFTLIRLASGSVFLLLLSGITSLNRSPSPAAPATTDIRPPSTEIRKGNWISAFLLFQYAYCFSLAYTLLSAASGAIILFASVQITMLMVAFIKGSRLHALEWLGIVLAFTGFIYLMYPGISAPSPLGFFLMVLSGIAWGGYTLRGRRSISPLTDTTWNFLRSLPFIAVALLFFHQGIQFNSHGLALAIASGAIASGLGYAIWYRALTHISTTQAAVLQLFVPVLTAISGVIWISEPITTRLFVASTIILGGILLVVLKPYYIKKISSAST